MSQDTEHPAIERAQRTLRQYRAGALDSDGAVTRRRFIIDPSDGALVLELTPDELTASQSVLHVPDEELPGAADTSLQLLLVLESIDPEREFVCDRFIAAHNKRSLGAWARARIDSARTSDSVIGGDELMIANPVRTDEGRLLRSLNADRGALRAAVLAGAGVDVDEPVAVACDPYGFDARGGVGVIRVDFDRRADDADEIALFIGTMLEHPPS